METKKSKYDTNPLDPEVGRKSEEMWGEGGGGTPTTEWVQEPTGKVGEPSEEARKNVYSEAPTRRYDNPPLEAPYPSIFVPPTYAPPKQQYQPNQNIYQAPPVADSQPPTYRPIAGIGIAEKWALVLAYCPAYIGLVVSLIELFLVPRRESKVRFHASQALALHLAILAIHMFLGIITTITGSSFGKSIFSAAAFVFLIVSMIRVGKGDKHTIAPLTEPSQWLNDHIEPRNQR
jgi:uncharacterized membrane protein